MSDDKCPNGTRLASGHMPSDDGRKCLACGLSLEANMSDGLRKELEGLAEAWEDDAASCRETAARLTGTPGADGCSAVAGAYEECAAEIRALLARHAAADRSET